MWGNHSEDDQDSWFEEDDWSDMDDEDLMTSNSPVDMNEISNLVDRKIVFHRSCLLGTDSAEFDVAGLLLESELALNNHDYKSSLICGLAAQKIANQPLAPTRLIEMICIYQLGDRDRAVTIMKEIATISKCQVSPYLMKKYTSTCEVLTFMPQLLDMLKAAEKKPPRNRR